MDADVFVNHKLRRGEAYVPAIERRIEIDRLAINGVGERLAQRPRTTVIGVRDRRGIRVNRYSRCADQRETNSKGQTDESGHRNSSRVREVMSELSSAFLLHRRSYGRGDGVGRGLGVV